MCSTVKRACQKEAELTKVKGAAGMDGIADALRFTLDLHISNGVICNVENAVCDLIVTVATWHNVRCPTQAMVGMGEDAEWTDMRLAPTSLSGAINTQNGCQSILKMGAC